MITFRKFIEKDRNFIEQVFKSTREPELKQTNWSNLQKESFILMQSVAQEADYKTSFPHLEKKLILYKNKQAGRLYLSETSSHLRLVDISLLPQFRGKGIGTTILSQLIKRAEKSKRILCLHVRKENRAMSLYIKSGFIIINSTGDYHYMELKSK